MFDAATKMSVPTDSIDLLKGLTVPLFLDGKVDESVRARKLVEKR